MMLSVMAAASAPLLINVGCGRVRRGGSSSPIGTPVRLGDGDSDVEIEVGSGCVGRAILLENTCEIEEKEDVGDAGDAVEVVEEDRMEKVVVVGESVAGGGILAPIPCDVGGCVKAGMGVEIKEVVDFWLGALEDGRVMG